MARIVCDNSKLQVLNCIRYTTADLEQADMGKRRTSLNSAMPSSCHRSNSRPPCHLTAGDRAPQCAPTLWPSVPSCKLACPARERTACVTCLCLARCSRCTRRGICGKEHSVINLRIMLASKNQELQTDYNAGGWIVFICMYKVNWGRRWSICTSICLCLLPLKRYKFIKGAGAVKSTLSLTLDFGPLLSQPA